MAARKKTTADQLVASIGNAEVKPSFVQKAGLRLALGVGSVIALATVGTVIFLCIHYPSGPQIPADLEPTKAKESIGNYKELSGVVIQNAVTMFQTIVTQALLPVFTAILGYIFAKAGENKEGL